MSADQWAPPPQPGPGATVRPGPGRTATVIACCLIALLLVLTLVAAGVLTLIVRGAARTHIVTVSDGHIGVQLEVPGKLAIDSADMTRRTPGCISDTYEFDESLILQANSHGCTSGASAHSSPRDQRIGNGHHGTYVTLADVPAPLDATTVTTPLGPARVFEQDYFEATNFTRNWQEPVVIIALDRPVDPDFPSLVLISPHGELSRDKLSAIAESASAYPYRSDPTRTPTPTPTLPGPSAT